MDVENERPTYLNQNSNLTFTKVIKSYLYYLKLLITKLVYHFDYLLKAQEF